MAAGEIETAYPGYPGSQDTFCVGTLEGVGRIYQVAFGKKLYQNIETLQFDLELLLEAI